MKIKNQIIVTLLALLVGVGLSACKDDIQRNPNLSYARGGQDAVEQEEAPEKKNNNFGVDDDKEEKSKKNKTRDRDEDDDDDEDEEDDNVAFEYPHLFFNGDGQSTCDGKSYRQTASVNAQLTNPVLDLDMTAARMYCKKECEKRANPELQKTAVGLTQYKRTTKYLLNKLKKSGFPYYTFLIYADSVRKKDGTVFEFDKPLPVFPLPQPLNRYKDFESQTYQANVTSGDKSFSVSIKVEKLRAQGNDLVLKMTNTIQDPTWAIYEVFPIPYTAEYNLNLEEKDVRTIKSVNRWYGDKNCDKKQETTTQTYVLCKKIKSGRTESFQDCL
jgi:hypothetical protein